MHTGLGNWGQETLYLRSGADQTQEAAKLGDVLSQQVITDARAHGAYEIRGMLCEVFTMLAPEPEWSFLLQEFGTYSGLRVVNALREENYWYHHGNTSPQHRSRRQLKEMLVPANREWRDSVVDRGVSLCKRVMAHVFS